MDLQETHWNLPVRVEEPVFLQQSQNTDKN